MQISIRGCCRKCRQQQSGKAKKSGFHFQVWRVLQSVFAAPALPHSHTGFSLQTPPLHLASILVPISQKFLILVSIFPANSDSTSDSSFLVHNFLSIPPLALPVLLSNSYLCSLQDLSLTPLLANSAFSFTVLPWDDLSATESSIQRTCLSFYRLP